MSLESLKQINEYVLDEDTALDRYADRMEAKRGEPTPDLAARVEEKFGEVLSRIKSCLYKGSFGVKMALMTGYTPDDVAKGVVVLFEAKGWKARHTYNDGYNSYESFDVELPMDWLDRMLL
jgi:hypothetical protein